jgi:hypothetical protein
MLSRSTEVEQSRRERRNAKYKDLVSLPNDIDFKGHFLSVICACWFSYLDYQCDLTSSPPTSRTERCALIK